MTFCILHIPHRSGIESETLASECKLHSNYLPNQGFLWFIHIRGFRSLSYVMRRMNTNESINDLTKRWAILVTKAVTTQEAVNCNFQQFFWTWHMHSLFGTKSSIIRYISTLANYTAPFYLIFQLSCGSHQPVERIKRQWKGNCQCSIWIL